MYQPTRACWQFMLSSAAVATILITTGLFGAAQILCGREESKSPATVITVFPEDSNEVLRNPGKGYILYNARNEVPELWQLAVAGYARIDWHMLQPKSENEYDWSAIDVPLEACKKHGLKMTFGIMNANSVNPGLDVPQWVYDAGAKYVEKRIHNYLKDVWYERKRFPIWDDPVFLEKLDNFVAALAARYNGDPDIEYIENRAYGNWGEWHQIDIDTTPPSDATLRRIVDMYADRFTRTRLIIPTNTVCQSDLPEPFAQYAVDQRGYGLKREGLVTLPDSMYGVQYCDGKAPAEGEWQSSYRDFQQTGRWSDEYIDHTFRVGKFTYYNLGYFGGDSAAYWADKAEQIRYWANRMGYWFRLTEASYPANLGNGSTETVVLKFRNDGIAPIYIRAHVKLALLDEAYNVLHMKTLEGVRPFDWKPGKVVVETERFSFPHEAKGRKLALGLFTDTSLAGPDIKLGTAGRRPDGWYVLSDMVGSDTLVHFEDLAEKTPIGWFAKSDTNSEQAAVGVPFHVHFDVTPRADVPPIRTYYGIDWGRWGWITGFDRAAYTMALRFNVTPGYKGIYRGTFALPAGKVLKRLRMKGGGTVEMSSDGNPTRTFKLGDSFELYVTGWNTAARDVTVVVHNPTGGGIWAILFDDIVYGDVSR
jgi:hypothetical protein